MSSAAAVLTSARVRALLPHISARRVARFREVLSRRVADTIVVLENPHDGHNLSAVLRTCDALGVSDVCVVERWESVASVPSVDKGSGKWLHVSRFASAEACCSHLHEERGARIFATSLGRGALPLDDAIALSLHAVPAATAAAGGARAASSIAEAGGLWEGGAEESRSAAEPPSVRFRPRVALVFGNEHRGCSAALLARADARFFIPQLGFVQSLNLSVACGIATSAFLRRTPDYCESAAAAHAAAAHAAEAAASASHDANGGDGDSACAGAGGVSGAADAAQSTLETARERHVGADSNLLVERLSAERVDEALLSMLLLSVTNAERILERKGVRPLDL